MRRAWCIAVLLLGCAGDPPELMTLTPALVAPGDAVSVSGLGFGEAREDSELVVWTLDEDEPRRIVLSDMVTAWSDTAIEVDLPPELLDATRDRARYAMHVESGRGLSNCLELEVALGPDPNIMEIAPPVSQAGTEIQILGGGFGDDAGLVLFSPDLVPTLGEWTDTSITLTLPADAAEVEQIRVQTLDGLLSAPQPFAIADPSRPTLDLLQRTIFTPRCALGPCHSVLRAGELSLVEGESYDNLVSVGSSQLPGALRVDPFSPETSLTINKLTEMMPLIGERMPQNGPYLSDGEVDLIRAWIVSGAPDN